MRAIMLMFDSLNRHYLPNYGNDWTVMPNFERLAGKAVTFDRFYAGSLPCMPARRDLHTGRYNFLHNSWSPLEPYDDSVIERMKMAGIYTHIATDHFHYWEPGGFNYLAKFDTYQMIRGQQGDLWMGQVERPYYPDTLSRRKNGESWRHDWINRSFIKNEDSMPQKKTFDAGLDFMRRNSNSDKWFLQIETFDPHEPFFTQPKYKELYKDDYHGKNLDWPDYGKNEYGPEATKHVCYEYAALLSMCDHYLGLVLDTMDEYNMWEDTMLIVNTDHGFMLGEKDWMGKNVQPMFEELTHIPFFIYDPRNPDVCGQRRESLCQTIDVPATLAEFFQIDPPEHMDGRSLLPVINNDCPIRDYAMFGIFGGHINITDGRYVYMKAPVSSDNGPLYEYTLMPCHMNAAFKQEELQNIDIVDGFPHMNGCRVMKIPGAPVAMVNAYWYGNRLYDLKNDPNQLSPIDYAQIALGLTEAIRDMMIKNEAPPEQFVRFGIPQSGDLTEECLEQNPVDSSWLDCFCTLSKRQKSILLIGCAMMREDEKQVVFQQLRQMEDPSVLSETELLDMMSQFQPSSFFELAKKAIRNLL